MQIETLSYSHETGILRLKCSGRFGVGSEGQPSGELLTRDIERWIANHADEIVTEIAVDYTDVHYSWGDGPVSSMVPFLLQGVRRFHLIASPSNHAALEGLIVACNLPWFVLSRTDGLEAQSMSTRSSNVRLTALRDQTKSSSDQFDTLADAISDVGYWCRWDADLPERVQLEFGGVQLASSETAIGPPRPIETLILRFFRPFCVVFMTNRSEWEPVLTTRGDLEPDPANRRRRDALRRRPSAPTELSVDWPLLLQQEQIGPLGIHSDMFTFQDVEIASAIMAEPHLAQDLIGTLPAVETWASTPAHVAFWAGAAGVVIAAEAMEMFTDTGPIALGQIARMRGAWFDYWKQYWKRRGHADALPMDWACEATIPAKDAVD